MIPFYLLPIGCLRSLLDSLSGSVTSLVLRNGIYQCIQETKIKLAAFSLRSRFQRLQESVAYPVGRQIIEQINCECSSKLPQYPWEARRRNRRTTEPFRMQAPEGGELSAIVELSEAFYPQRSALIRFFWPSKSSIFRLRLVLTFCVLSQSFFFDASQTHYIYREEEK